MTLAGAAGVPITLVKRTKGDPDALGNDTWTEQRVDVRGIYNPGGSSEQVQGQDMVTTQPSVYLPAGTDVSSTDRIEVAGLSYEVDASPNQWISPFSDWNPGVEVKLRRVTG